MRAWLQAGIATAVVAPIGGRSVGVDQCKLELAVAVKVHAIHRHTALMVEKLGHGSLDGAKAEGDDPEQQAGS